MTAGAMVKQGRRAIDWVWLPIAFVAKQTANVLDIWKDDRTHRWSTRRILLWQWTILGEYCIYHEITAKAYLLNGQIVPLHFLSNGWIQAWAWVEGAFIAAVFGPIVADYMKNAAPVLTSIGTAIRDAVSPLAPKPTVPQAGVPPRSEIKKALEQAAGLSSYVPGSATPPDPSAG